MSLISVQQFGNFVGLCTQTFVPACGLWSPQVQPSCALKGIAIGDNQLVDIGKLLPVIHLRIEISHVADTH